MIRRMKLILRMKYFSNLEYIIGIFINIEFSVNFSLSTTHFYMKLFYLKRCVLMGIKDGSIEFLEFLGAIACCRYKKSPSKTKIKQMFAALDTNNGSLLSVEYIKRFGKIFFSDDQPDDSNLSSLIQKLDTNCDGNINLSEFSANKQIYERHSSSI